MKLAHSTASWLPKTLVNLAPSLPVPTPNHFTEDPSRNPPCSPDLGSPVPATVRALRRLVCPSLVGAATPRPQTRETTPRGFPSIHCRTTRLFSHLQDRVTWVCRRRPAPRLSAAAAVTVHCHPAYPTLQPAHPSTHVHAIPILYPARLLLHPSRRSRRPSALDITVPSPNNPRRRHPSPALAHRAFLLPALSPLAADCASLLLFSLPFSSPPLPLSLTLALASLPLAINLLVLAHSLPQLSFHSTLDLTPIYHTSSHLSPIRSAHPAFCTQFHRALPLLGFPPATRNAVAQAGSVPTLCLRLCPSSSIPLPV
ncbi:unnamed protein product [Periconia digitata]|uniref:Uncharacterized protein n=1 Tax=Periconia digitata TaxID=1303443 RepID=A0A9W4UDM9_9PLEO|nr:unnamed protein product [Periconia digitata]